jgi:hypothetical protein
MAACALLLLQYGKSFSILLLFLFQIVGNVFILIQTRIDAQGQVAQRTNGSIGRIVKVAAFTSDDVVARRQEYDFKVARDGANTTRCSQGPIDSCGGHSMACWLGMCDQEEKVSLLVFLRLEERSSCWSAMGLEAMEER